MPSSLPKIEIPKTHYLVINGSIVVKPENPVGSKNPSYKSSQSSSIQIPYYEYKG